MRWLLMVFVSTQIGTAHAQEIKGRQSEQRSPTTELQLSPPIQDRSQSRHQEIEQLTRETNELKRRIQNGKDATSLIELNLRLFVQALEEAIAHSAQCQKMMDRLEIERKQGVSEQELTSFRGDVTTCNRNNAKLFTEASQNMEHSEEIKRRAARITREIERDGLTVQEKEDRRKILQTLIQANEVRKRVEKMLEERDGPPIY